MRKCCFATFVVVAVLIVSPGVHAQSPLRQAQGGEQSRTAAGPGAGAAQGIPNLSGMWQGLGGIPRTADNAICGILPLCGALLGQKPVPSPDTSEEPAMLPWAEAQYKSLREGVAPAANPPEDLNPSWNGCMSEGPVQTLQSRFNVLELRQFPDVVLLLYSQDHGVRRVYLDGRGHPANWQPTWMGHSIGRYEADTLVIDTTGIKDKAWLDTKGHPHTGALRVTERIRRVQPERLQIEITIDDPQTYKKPWSMKLVKGLQAPGPLLWDASECEELLQMGTHFSAESPLLFQKPQPAPAATY